jgi:AcrR family transcriptional regulator
MGRPKEHGAQTRAALLTAAAALLHAEGAEAISVRRVAAAVGTSTRAVYSLFEDKDGLLRALSEDVAETMRRHHEAIPERTDPLAEIVDLAFAYRAAALAKPQLYDLFFGLVGATNDQTDPLVALAFRSFERVLRTIRRAVAAGLFPGRKVLEVGLNLFAMGHGLASLELRCLLGDPDRAATIWRQSVEATLTGLRQPPSTASPSPMFGM